MKSFLQGKKQLAVEPLRAPAMSSHSGAAKTEARHAGASTAHASHGEGAHVEVVKEGDKVVRLVVTCGCGERVEIECLYSAGR